jgi:hypothetical protein
MCKQNDKSIHASSVIHIRPYYACEYFCLEHIFPLQVGAVNKKQKNKKSLSNSTIRRNTCGILSAAVMKTIRQGILEMIN